jgi:hypothetical protein
MRDLCELTAAELDVVVGGVAQSSDSISNGTAIVLTFLTDSPYLSLAKQIAVVLPNPGNSSFQASTSAH